MDDKYSITLSDGTRWTYAPQSEADLAPWSADDLRYMFARCLTPADFRAAADVIERWERDHLPRWRRRVVEIGERYWARHTTLPGWVYGNSAANARGFAQHQTALDLLTSLEATDANVDALLSLRDQPDEEYTDGE
jgi:hypothetical protein